MFRNKNLNEKTFKKAQGILWLALWIVIISQPVWAVTTVSLGNVPFKYVLKGTIVTPDDLIIGEVVIENDTITCVANDCADPPGATLLTISNAYIFPGFIDSHNHVAYNFLPKWTPPKLYQNRSQWQGSQSYKDFKKPYDILKKEKGLFCEMVKYGEIKALISGVTTIQGTSPNMNCFRTLIRNAENQNGLDLPDSHIRTYILDIKSFKGSVNWTSTKSFVVHLSEGIDEKSRKEFDTLKQKGLLKEQTAIIHGTAFGETEFREMAQVGAKLIWSPKSNLVLYGKTTNIKQAVDKGVLVSLGVDWNPSGSDTIFDELRIAEHENKTKFDSAIKGSDWIKLITVNPAKALALDSYIGKLAPGFKADISVVEQNEIDPNLSLLKTHLQDVEMVWVGGDLLYADETILEKIKPGQCESLNVYGSKKRICVKDTKGNVYKGNQTLSDIQTQLRDAYPNIAPLTP